MLLPPIVTAPAPLFTNIPPVPSARTRLVEPSLRRRFVPALLKVSDKAFLAPFSVTVCAMLLAVVMLKNASSLAVGSAAGFGVAAPEAVDQFAAVFHAALAAPSQ